MLKQIYEKITRLLKRKEDLEEMIISLKAKRYNVPLQIEYIDNPIKKIQNKINSINEELKGLGYND